MWLPRTLSLADTRFQNEAIVDHLPHHHILTEVKILTFCVTEFPELHNTSEGSFQDKKIT